MAKREPRVAVVSASLYALSRLTQAFLPADRVVQTDGNLLSIHIQVVGSTVAAFGRLSSLYSR